MYRFRPLLLIVFVVLLTAVTLTSIIAQEATEEDDFASAYFTIPGDTVFPEGIAYDAATGTFYVGSTEDGAVYRGQIDGESQELELFLEGDTAERAELTGMKVDPYGRLWMTGRRSGNIHIYDTQTAEQITILETPASDNTLINDIALTSDTAYITDSFRPILFRVPFTEANVGEIEEWLSFEDSALEYRQGFNLNGIVVTEDEQALITVQYNTGDLYRIDIATQEITQIDLGGEALTAGDGLGLAKQRLYVVRNSPGEIVVVELDEEYTTGTIQERLIDENFNTPTTLALTEDSLLVVNSQLNGSTPELPFTVSRLSLP